MQPQHAQHGQQVVQAHPWLAALKLVRKAHAGLRKIRHALLRQLQLPPAISQRLTQLRPTGIGTIVHILAGTDSHAASPRHNLHERAEPGLHKATPKAGVRAGTARSCRSMHAAGGTWQTRRRSAHSSSGAPAAGGPGRVPAAALAGPKHPRGMPDFVPATCP